MNRPVWLRTSAARLTLAGSLTLIGALAATGIAIGQTPAPAAPAAAAPAAPAAPAEIKGDPEKGRLKSASCVGCHAIPGYKADFPSVYHVPMLGGQSEKYIEVALKAYQKGDRRFPSMIATAKSLSDQDIADLAAYFAAQR